MMIGIYNHFWYTTSFQRAEQKMFRLIMILTDNWKILKNNNDDNNMITAICRASWHTTPSIPLALAAAIGHSATSSSLLVT